MCSKSKVAHIIVHRRTDNVCLTRIFRDGAFSARFLYIHRMNDARTIGFGHHQTARVPASAFYV